VLFKKMHMVNTETNTNFNLFRCKSILPCTFTYQINNVTDVRNVLVCSLFILC